VVGVVVMILVGSEAHRSNQMLPFTGCRCQSRMLGSKDEPDAVADPRSLGVPAACHAPPEGLSKRLFHIVVPNTSKNIQIPAATPSRLMKA